ncbi:Trehalose utilization [Rosistilla carotiformis]|uniref:Trehalose utilization n=1 Tax=Rosistilla carotiformis TaxID=2528017 RepID=A0A518K194_9BACT|nr:ThuA domain-containing protein [Rosistilla carotiformis]QDV71573.1 Trehalose utilization [Rosistilla carotiformis]
MLRTLFLLLLASIPLSAGAAEKLKALIVDGQNNHGAWPKTTVMMKRYLEETERFTVDVQRTQYTWNGGKLLDEYPLNDGRKYQSLSKPKSDPDFKPTFSDYDVVVNNFGHSAAAWPKETQVALDKFVHSGGGLVVVHAADNAFSEWPQYNQMIGLGGWGGRNEKSGPYVFIDADGKTVRDTSPGRGGNHGPQHEYQIVVRNPDHPITRGLPRSWMHTKDELYQQLRGPADKMTILATAFAAEDFKGTGRHEPMMMTIDYGKGRVYHTPMGHADYSMECVGFITTLIRGTEWAATGDVTLTEVPKDFPSFDKASKRSFE